MLKLRISQLFWLLTIESCTDPTVRSTADTPQNSPTETPLTKASFTRKNHIPHSDVKTSHGQLIAGMVIILIAIFCTMLLSLMVGARTVAAGEILVHLREIFSAMSDPLSVPPDLRIVAEQRIPRTITGVLVGACLGTAGALIQGHTRNPLADPSILGISHGAALAVVLATIIGGFSGFGAVTGWAFIGAISATAVVFSLASIGTAKLNPITLILGGAALSAVLAAITTALILYNIGALELMRFWSIGAFTNATATTIAVFIPLALVGLIIAFATAPHVNLLHLGDEMAQSLGLNTQRARIVGIAIIAFLAAIATAAAGPVGFLGLVIPQISRAICGTDYRWVLPYSALLGSLIALIADCVGRWIIRPGEIEVGIVLAFVGAPIFLWLIYRDKVSKL